MKTLQDIRAQLPVYPIELQKPDISCWKSGNTGIDYVHRFDSGQPGPHVMITGLIHGNEICGAIALDTLLRHKIRPLRGRLSLVFANTKAYEKFDPSDPDGTRYIDQDMNRVWAKDILEGKEQSAELARARLLRPLIDSVDYLLDIHSMHEKSAPLLLTGLLPKTIAFAQELKLPAHLMIDEGHALGKRLRDYGQFADPDTPQCALLIECGQHFELKSGSIALDACYRFLQATKIIAPQDADLSPCFSSNFTPLSIQVTHAIVAESMDFHFCENFLGMENIARAGTLIAIDGKREIRTPYDNCIIMQPSLRQLSKGVTVVRLGRLREILPSQDYQKKASVPLR